jgi:hypothetical protein
MGTWMTESTGLSQRRSKVPWTREWMNNKRERRRNAFVESVDSVSGRNSKI